MRENTKKDYFLNFRNINKNKQLQFCRIKSLIFFVKKLSKNLEI